MALLRSATYHYSDLAMDPKACPPQKKESSPSGVGRGNGGFFNQAEICLLARGKGALPERMASTRFILS